jgi:RHS repeat-associated protein
MSLVGEYDGTGSEIKAYGYKPGSTWTTDPIFIKQNNTYYFYHNDHLGTPQKITAMNGAVVWSAKYSSFGKANVEVETITNNLRFPGQYYDQETGLHYNFFRYYDSLTGRYLTADPIGLDGGVNLFTYVKNDPMNNVDPLGLYSTYTFDSFCEYVSGGEAIGGGLLECWIDGPCMNGKRTVFHTLTTVVGITAGSPGGVNYFDTGFEYYGSINNINNDKIFEGTSHIISAGGALPSFGGSYASIKLGSTLSRGFGKQTGADLSADAFWGYTNVVDSWTECCDD